MKIVDIRDAESNLSRLVEEAANGEEIVIAKDGQGIVRLVPLPKKRGQKRKLGLLAGKLTIPEDFDAPLPPDLLDAFEGR